MLSRGEQILLQHLHNLLARIHRDGGHHSEKVGLTQSIADADDKVVAWLGRDMEEEANGGN
jgi:hypothetical protein